MSTNTIKDKCRGCLKFLLLHNKIMSCHSCDKIVHAECAMYNFEYNHLNNTWQCRDCISNSNLTMKYNPFSNISYDKYDSTGLHENEDISEISKVLESCQSLNGTKMKKFFKSNPEAKSKLSLLFNNIDGNSSNFDSFVADISQYCHKFSLIGIAETNINPIHKNLYTIPGYNSEYNEKLLDKKKGSGIAIYVKDNMTFNRLDDYCQCTKNLECLFIELTNINEPYIIGVAYRPPSGSEAEALTELDEIMQALPNKRVIICGDFNIDLFKQESQQFESNIYGNNMIPLISQATHFKPDCNPSLLDNVLTNSIENVIMAGVLEGGVSHHHPVICFIDDNMPKIDKNSNFTPKYDYCESNMTTFIEYVQEIEHKHITYSLENFDDFVNDIKQKVDEHFLVDETSAKTSKRTLLSNPWITPGIIASVKKKHYYYKQWKRTNSKNNKSGCNERYEIYKIFRKKLKGIIKFAKKKYFHKKFASVQGNMKKTWQLINELRGKTKNNIKSCFKIDGKLVEEKREIANGFNKFFSSIAKTMNAKLYSSRPIDQSKAQNKSFDEYLSKRISNSIFLFECSSDEILQIITEFDSNKASDISLTVLKKMCHSSFRTPVRFSKPFYEVRSFSKNK